MNTDDLIKRIATGLGIDTDGLNKITRTMMAQEAMAQEEQMQNEQMMMNMAEKAVAPVANGNLSKQTQG